MFLKKSWMDTRLQVMLSLPLVIQVTKIWGTVYIFID